MRFLGMLVRWPSFILGVCCLLGSSALGPQWRDARDGDWRYTDSSGSVIRQTIPDVRADVFLHTSTEEGSCFRTFVEMSPSGYRAGLWIGLTENPANWLLLVLDGQQEGRGFAVLDSVGAILWEDAWVEWTYYTPYLLEAVCEPGRFRVQMFEWDGHTLLSQSDWITRPEILPENLRYFGLHTDRAIARFQGWQVSDEPLSPIVSNAPNRLRLVQGEDSDWRVVGPGIWAWTSPEQASLRQGAAVERTTAVSRSDPRNEGIWRSSVTINPNAGGAGLVFLTDENASTGFCAWLGGTPGAGALMLYSLSPLEALWSSDQGLWHYDIPYQIEASVEGGTVRARLLAEDGLTEIAVSPSIPLAEHDAVMSEWSGLQTWKGTADFGPIVFSAAPESEKPMIGDEHTPPGWQIVSGDWVWETQEDRLIVRGQGGESVAQVFDQNVTGNRGRWSCVVTAGEGAQRIGLLIQADLAQSAGFLINVTEAEVTLQTAQGRILWQQPFNHPLNGATYLLEGIVATDRVRARVCSPDGTPLIESSDCYLSDSNNERTGFMGFQTTGGAAVFSDGIHVSSQ
jgi:hypothetical protein